MSIPIRWTGDSPSAPQSRFWRPSPGIGIHGTEILSFPSFRHSYPAGLPPAEPRLPVFQSSLISSSLDPVHWELSRVYGRMKAGGRGGFRMGMGWNKSKDFHQGKTQKEKNGRERNWERRKRKGQSPVPVGLELKWIDGIPFGIDEWVGWGLYGLDPSQSWDYLPPRPRPRCPRPLEFPPSQVIIGCWFWVRQDSHTLLTRTHSLTHPLVSFMSCRSCPNVTRTSWD